MRLLSVLHFYWFFSGELHVRIKAFSFQQQGIACIKNYYHCSQMTSHLRGKSAVWVKQDN